MWELASKFPFCFDSYWVLGFYSTLIHLIHPLPPCIPESFSDQVFFYNPSPPNYIRDDNIAGLENVVLMKILPDNQGSVRGRLAKKAVMILH